MKNNKKKAFWESERQRIKLSIKLHGDIEIGYSILTFLEILSKKGVKT